jgi:hypothetical protein
MDSSEIGVLSLVGSLILRAAINKFRECFEKAMRRRKGIKEGHLRRDGKMKEGQWTLDYLQRKHGFSDGTRIYNEMLANGELLKDEDDSPAEKDATAESDDDPWPTSTQWN